jgi:hypothetical protein
VDYRHLLGILVGMRVAARVRIWTFPGRIDMRGRYIDFISSYCDGWCERCTFTDRCSVFAVKIALHMCEGDAGAAIELAVGTPPPRSPAEARRRQRFAAEIAEVAPTKEEIAVSAREEDLREERVDESPITTAAMRVALLAHSWIRDHADALAATATGVVKEALEVATHDAFLIAAKLHRALCGRDRNQYGDRDDHGIQNDWNGSAKVALICITRSATAWEILGDATADPDATQIAVELRGLARIVEGTFPDAWKFRRPGFDSAKLR